MGVGFQHSLTHKTLVDNKLFQQEEGILNNQINIIKFLNKFSDLRNLIPTLNLVVSALRQLFIKVWQEVVLSAMSEHEQLQNYFK